MKRVIYDLLQTSLYYKLVTKLRSEQFQITNKVKLIIFNFVSVILND